MSQGAAKPSKYMSPPRRTVPAVATQKAMAPNLSRLACLPPVQPDQGEHQERERDGVTGIEHLEQRMSQRCAHAGGVRREDHPDLGDDEQPTGDDSDRSRRRAQW